MNKIVEKKKVVIIAGILITAVIAIIGAVLIMTSKKSDIQVAAKNPNTSTEIVLSLDNDEQEELEQKEEEEEEIEEEEVLVQDESESEEVTEEQAEQSQKNVANLSQYYIKINYQANVVTVYQRNSDGELSPIRAMTCSTGSATPRYGVYSVQGKWVWGKLFGNVWGHYVTKIVGNILFHSVPYLQSDPSTLEYWEYDKLGTTASAGCVRLAVQDSKWIFDNMPIGTPIEFYASADPGPLGKPGTRTISGNVECRGWDPTDPDPNNPWHHQNQSPQSQPSENQNVVPEESNNEQINVDNNDKNEATESPIELVKPEDNDSKEEENTNESEIGESSNSKDSEDSENTVSEGNNEEKSDDENEE